VKKYGTKKSSKGRDKEERRVSLLCGQGRDISCAKMARGGKKGGKPEKVAKVGVEKESGYLYFVDKQGDISCAKMVRGGKKKKKSKK